MADLPVLTAADIEALLPDLDLAGALRRAFTALGEGAAAQPPQTLTLLPVGGGDFITYAGALSDAFGVKVSPYLPGPSGGLVTAWTLLMSCVTGAPLLLCDSKRLTAERTGATTALATDLLAPPEARVLAIVGAGEIALAHWVHARELRPWSQVRVWSPKAAAQGPERLARFQRADSRAGLAPSLAAACEGADVIMLCTASPSVVLDPRTLRSSALVTSIATNAPLAHEVPPDWLPQAAVYCDYRATAPLSAGEMVLASKAGIWSADQILGDLPELLTQKAVAPPPGRTVFFRSIGLGLEDVAVAREALRALQARA